MFRGLLKICYPNLPELGKFERTTFEAKVSKYKNCDLKDASEFSFLEPLYLNNFKQSVKNEYNTSLIAMHEFVNSFINTDTEDIYVQLVELLLDLVEHDRSIEDDDFFYVCPSGTALKKAELRNFYDGTNTVCLPALLLGMWHFAIQKIPNSKGHETIKLWGKNPIEHLQMANPYYVDGRSTRKIKVRLDIPENPDVLYNIKQEPALVDANNAPANRDSQKAVPQEKMQLAQELSFDNCAGSEEMLDALKKTIDRNEMSSFLRGDKTSFNYCDDLPTKIDNLVEDIVKYVFNEFKETYNDTLTYKKIEQLYHALEDYFALSSTGFGSHNSTGEYKRKAIVALYYGIFPDEPRYVL